jgi:hypothetical protein
MKAWMCGIWLGAGLYGSNAATPPVFDEVGAGKRSVSVARRERWKGGKVVASSVS